jgi:hypothetical protein
MKVKDLITLLTVKDPEMRVVVDGYESGYNEVENIKLVNIVPNPNKDDIEKDNQWWAGEFNETLDKNTEVAILLPRKN